MRPPGKTPSRTDQAIAWMAKTGKTQSVAAPRFGISHSAISARRKLLKKRAEQPRCETCGQPIEEQ